LCDLSITIAPSSETELHKMILVATVWGSRCSICTESLLIHGTDQGWYSTTAERAGEPRRDADAARRGPDGSDERGPDQSLWPTPTPTPPGVECRCNTYTCTRHSARAGQRSIHRSETNIMPPASSYGQSKQAKLWGTCVSPAPTSSFSPPHVLWTL
jgi:hypothetical protein